MCLDTRQEHGCGHVGLWLHLLPKRVAKGSRFTLGSEGWGVFAQRRFSDRSHLQPIVTAADDHSGWGELWPCLG